MTFCTVSSGQPMKFPAAMALSHVDLTGYPHTACIHLIPCSVDGRSYTLPAISSALRFFLDGFSGCHCPRFWMSGMRYRPCSSLTPTKSGALVHRISTSVSLWTVTPVLVKMEMVPSSAVFPTLMSDVGKSLNVSARDARSDNCVKGSFVTFSALHISPFATITRLVDFRRIGNPAAFLSFSLT